MKVYHLDFETFSRADLKKVGAWRYAKDPSAEVLCLSVQEGDGSPLLWVPGDIARRVSWVDPLENMEAEDMLHSMSEDKESLVYAHNAPFEYAVWQSIMTRYGFARLLPQQMRCTALMARRACIPHSLEKCGAYLGLDAQKDAAGKTLIRKFCVMQKPDKHHLGEWRRMPWDEPGLFRQMCKYCIQDTRVEAEVHKKLYLFELRGMPLHTFHNTLRVNETGFPVDLSALHHTIALVETKLHEIEEEFMQLTGGIAPTQVKALLPWLRERGYQGNNLQASTMDEELEDDADESEDKVPWATSMHPDARRALELRKEMSFAAVKKLYAMVNCAGPDDNRVRGTLIDHGASTGRWSSSLVQQQNLKRPTISDSVGAFKMLRHGKSTEFIELVHGSLLEVVSSCVRHFINDGEEPMDTVDYAAVEARIVCWLAGQADALLEFASGVDRYKVMASRIFRTTVESITKDQRFVGKQTVLGCGFGMGATKFSGTCAQLGQSVDDELAELAVTIFRASHEQVVRLWYSLEAAAKNAINNPNQEFKASGGKLSCFSSTTAGKRFLFLKLPSGRLLSYPEPSIDADGGITFYGQLPAKAVWGRVSTYGGKLVENATQAVAADCMAVGLHNAVQTGHQVCMLVHDEAVRLTRGCGLSREHFEHCLTNMPPWARGLPLAVEGETVECYKK